MEILIFQIVTLLYTGYVIKESCGFKEGNLSV